MILSLRTRGFGVVRNTRVPFHAAPRRTPIYRTPPNNLGHCLTIKPVKDLLDRSRRQAAASNSAISTGGDRPHSRLTVGLIQDVGSIYVLQLLHAYRIPIRGSPDIDRYVLVSTAPPPSKKTAGTTLTCHKARHEPRYPAGGYARPIEVRCKRIMDSFTLMMIDCVALMSIIDVKCRYSGRCEMSLRR